MKPGAVLMVESTMWSAASNYWKWTTPSWQLSPMLKGIVERNSPLLAAVASLEQDAELVVAPYLATASRGQSQRWHGVPLCANMVHEGGRFVEKEVVGGDCLFGGTSTAHQEDYEGFRA